MSLKRQLRKYRDEVRMILYIFIILLAFLGYSFTQKKYASEANGSTLSSNDTNKVNPSPLITTNPILPSLVIPTTIQINIYINNTSPISTQIYNELLNPSVINNLLPTQYSTNFPSTSPTINVVSSVTPFVTTTFTPTPTPTYTPTPTLGPLMSTFTGKYFNNKNISGTPITTRTDKEINFKWGTGKPDNSLPNDFFSVIWTGTLNSEAAIYQITLNHDDGMRVYIDDNLVHDHWVNHSEEIEVIPITLTRGIHSLKVEYFEYNSGATAIFDIKKL